MPPQPHDAYDLFQRGSSFLAAGHPGQAALLLGRAAELEPEKTSIREALGRARFALGRYDAAAEAFTAVVERAPTNAYAHYGLARSLLAGGHPAEAMAHARLAVAMQPDCDEFQATLERCTARAEGAEPSTPDDDSGAG